METLPLAHHLKAIPIIGTFRIFSVATLRLSAAAGRRLRDRQSGPEPRPTKMFLS